MSTLFLLYGQERLLLLDASCQNHVLQLLELMAKKDTTSDRPIHLECKDVQKKIAALEAARRMSFKNRVTIVAQDPDIRECVG